MFFFLFFTIKLLIEFLSYKAETNKSKPKHQNIEDNKFRQFFFSLSKLSLFFFFLVTAKTKRGLLLNLLLFVHYSVSETNL